MLAVGDSRPPTNTRRPGDLDAKFGDASTATWLGLTLVLVGAVVIPIPPTELEFA